METPWSTTAKYISSTAVSVDFGEGNEAADTAAKEALDKEPTDDLMPLSDLKPLTVKYYTSSLEERMGQSSPSIK